MLKICGYYKHRNGNEYVIWEDEGGAWHVTDGIIDVTDHGSRCLQTICPGCVICPV